MAQGDRREQKHVPWQQHMTELIFSRLISRKTCAPPDPQIMRALGKPSKDPLSSEEVGSFLLWVWPELLGWPFQVAWIFSPVTGNTKWPGDLWGLDDRGNLLIVETKVAKQGARPQNPLKDFVGFERRPKAKVREGSVLETPALRSRWLRLIEKEREFIKKNYSLLSSGEIKLGKHEGVVPYSSKRSQTWTWRRLYIREIAPKIVGKYYQRKTEANLLERAKQGNPRPHYFALFSVYDECSPSLSERGLTSYRSLCHAAGKNHVHLLAVKTNPIRRNSIEVMSWHLALNRHNQQSPR